MPGLSTFWNRAQSNMTGARIMAQQKADDPPPSPPPSGPIYALGGNSKIATTLAPGGIVDGGTY